MGERDLLTIIQKQNKMRIKSSQTKNAERWIRYAR